MTKSRTRLLLFKLLLLVSTLLAMALVSEVVLRLVYPHGYFSYAPDPTTRATSEFTYHIYLNSWGLRDREFSHDDLQKKKILLLGDSMTFGVGVESQDTFAKLVENKLLEARLEYLVVNAGVRATGTDDQFRQFKQLSKNTSFDLVCFCFYPGNDSDENYQDVTRRRKENLLPGRRRPNAHPVQRWMAKNTILYSFLYYKLKTAAYALKLIPSFQGQAVLLKDYSERAQRGWDATFEVIKEIKRWFDENEEAELMFLVLPADFQVDPGKQDRYGLTTELYDYRKPNRLLAGALREAGIPLLDMTDDFAEHYQRNPHDKRYYPIDRHFNKKGHELVADLLTRFLTEQGFVD